MAMKKLLYILSVILLTAGLLLSCGDSGGSVGGDGGDGGDVGGDPLPWDGVTIDTSWYTNNPAADSFNISTPAQLAGLAKIVNDNRSGFNKKTIIQTADLDLAGLQWTSIGLGASHYFSGTYDGNGKTISGLNINIADYYQGLFGSIGSDSTVKNVKLLDVSITVTGSTNLYIGAVAGFSNGRVEACTVSGSVTGGSQVGGVVGSAYATGATVSGCSFSGSVTGSGNYVGGIVGHYIGKVSLCSFSGSVKGLTCIGGVAGENKGSITNCYATVSVEATYATGAAGGIVGNQRDDGSVQYCYATGSVQGYTAGGIVGTSIGSVNNSAALNTDVTGTNARRVADGGTLANNYGSDGMLINGATLSSGDPGSANGKDVTAAYYNTEEWWTSAGCWPDGTWDFVNVWEMSDGNNAGSLPVLK